MARPKIAMIGGGSFNWSPKLIRDVVLTEELQDAEFRLHDINREAAEIIAAVGSRYSSEWNLGARFQPTTDLARALDGADFIVITIAAGGFDAMGHDMAIPERYGIYQTVGDTVGPGGWARGLRNIPVFARFARSAARRCPRAMILNYSNPMGALTGTLSALTSQPVVGLCHGLFECYEYLMNIFELKREEDIRIRYCGINHFFWILDFSVKGQPGYPLLRRKLRGGKRLNDLIRKSYTNPYGDTRMRWLVTGELFEEFGYVPYMGDRHISEFLSSYLAPNQKKIQEYHLQRTAVADRRAWFRARRRAAIALANGRSPLEKVRSRETAADIMAARWAKRDFVDVVNLPNVGQIANLPRGAVVETPGVVNMLGFTPLACGEMPASLINLIMPHAVNQNLIVEAGIEGNWEKAYLALINDPLCSHLTIPETRKMGRELLEANREHLPQFFGG